MGPERSSGAAQTGRRHSNSYEVLNDALPEQSSGPKRRKNSGNKPPKPLGSSLSFSTTARKQPSRSTSTEPEEAPSTPAAKQQNGLHKVGCEGQHWGCSLCAAADVSLCRRSACLRSLTLHPARRCRAASRPAKHSWGHQSRCRRCNGWLSRRQAQVELMLGSTFCEDGSTLTRHA